MTNLLSFPLNSFLMKVTLKMHKESELCILKVPFISDKFNGKLKRFITMHSVDIQVVTQPAPSL